MLFTRGPSLRGFYGSVKGVLCRNQLEMVKRNWWSCTVCQLGLCVGHHFCVKYIDNLLLFEGQPSVFACLLWIHCMYSRRRFTSVFLFRSIFKCCSNVGLSCNKSVFCLWLVFEQCHDCHVWRHYGSIRASIDTDISFQGSVFTNT